MKKTTIFIVLSLNLLVLSMFLSGCVSQEYAVMGDSILAPEPVAPGSTAAPKKKTIDEGLGAPLKVAAATASSISSLATGEAGAGPGPEMTIDGLGGSRWSTAYSDGEWLLLDLGATKKIKAVILDWEVACPRTMRVLVSVDNAKWTEVYNGGGRPGKKRIDFTPTNARYVKLDLIKRATGWGFSLWEVKIYE
ncbi:MAG: discoidin domain-containing protein [bacterium]